MRKIFVSSITAVIIMILFGCCHPINSQPINNVGDLESKINQKLNSLSGEFALSFVNLSDTTERVLINENELFHAASTMKTPVMIELYRQAEAGEFTLDDSILVKNEFRSIVDGSRYQMTVDEDSEAGLYDFIGKKKPIRELMNEMITMSSNLATNILIEKVGAENVTETMRSYGADSIMVLRGVEDIKAFEQGLSNRTTAHDEMKIYSKIGVAEAVSEEASGQMINILKKQKYNEMIPAQLPAEVQVAHKTGWITGVHHDAGIVILPNGDRYVLVMLSKNAHNREEVLSTFANISRMIYDFVVQ